MTYSRRTIVGSIPLLLASTKARAQTMSARQNWPVRPVRFIVPAAAGSAGDDVCRLVAQKLGEKFGQQFVIINQPAAVGTLAIADLARAAPDGYTIGQISTTTNVIAKLYNPELSYDPVKNFAPISLLGSSPYVLAVFPGLPVNERRRSRRARQGKAAAAEQRRVRHHEPGLFGRQIVRATSQDQTQSDSLSLIRAGGARRRRRPSRHAVLDTATRRAAYSHRQAARACNDRREALRHARRRADVGGGGLSGLRCRAVARDGGAARHATRHRQPSSTARWSRSSPPPTCANAMLRQSFVAESSSPDGLAQRIGADMEKWRDARGGVRQGDAISRMLPQAAAGTGIMRLTAPAGRGRGDGRCRAAWRRAARWRGGPARCRD